MFKKKPILKYESANIANPDIVIPSKSLIPNWFKQEKPVQPPDTSFKNCTPFLDSMLSGYLVLLPVDLLVVQSEKGPFIHWQQAEQGLPMVGFRFHNSIDRIPTPHGYHKDSFFWKFPIAFEIPLGYSVLVTQPLNRFELPFQIFSTVIDGGWALAPHANLAFFLQEGFEGIIPQGTPIAQLIPFKNERWISQKTEGLVQEGLLNKAKSDSVYTGWYKKNWWVRKHYE